MAAVIDAGRLDQRLEVLELRETGAGIWTWETSGLTWAQAVLSGKTNLFSRVGIGARDVQITLRRQELTLHNALRWGGLHLFLSAIVPQGRGHLEVSAALVEPVQCVAQPWHNEKGEGNRARRVDDPAVIFPGVLTEQYLRYQPEESYAKASGVYVLVTSKAIQLQEGVLVTVREGPAAAIYNVQACHVLDAFKNEYEIAFSRDI